MTLRYLEIDDELSAIDAPMTGPWTDRESELLAEQEQIEGRLFEVERSVAAE